MIRLLRGRIHRTKPSDPVSLTEVKQMSANLNSVARPRNWRQGPMFSPFLPGVTTWPTTGAM